MTAKLYMRAKAPINAAPKTPHDASSNARPPFSLELESDPCAAPEAVEAFAVRLAESPVNSTAWSLVSLEQEDLSRVAFETNWRSAH